MDITRFFTNRNTTPTSRSSDVTTIDMTSEKNLSGDTPVINKVLFGTDTTSISAKKGCASVKSESDRVLGEERPPLHNKTDRISSIVVIKSGDELSEGKNII